MKQLSYLLRHRCRVTVKRQNCVLKYTVPKIELLLKMWVYCPNQLLFLMWFQGAGLCHVASPGEEDSGWSPQPGGQAGHDPPLAAPCEQEHSLGAAHRAGIQRAEPGERPGGRRLQAKQLPPASHAGRVFSLRVWSFFLESLGKDPSCLGHAMGLFFMKEWACCYLETIRQWNNAT